jgi:LysM repeat protein
MRAFPDFADVVAVLKAPSPEGARRRGRYLAGSLATAGSVAFFLATGGSAEAKTVVPHASTALARPTTTYTIQNGDTLTSIAKRFGVGMDVIATANHVANVHRIRAGDTLTIPSTVATTTAVTKAAAQAVTPPVAPRPASKGKEAANADLRAIKAAASPGGALPPELRSRSDRVRLQGAFRSAAHEHGVPVELLQALDWHESGWQNTVVSSTGAVGIGQLMPDTVAFVNENLLHRPLDPKKPEDNIRMGAAFLRYLLDQTNGDYRTALAAYYQGLRSINEIGPYDETITYVKTVLAVQRAYF